MADPKLARYAGQFVWLALDFDKPANQRFLAQQGVTYTPSFFVLDPVDERPAAAQLGGMTLPELTAFLDRGERGVIEKPRSPAEAALAQGDELLGRGNAAAAASAYRDALRFGGKTWPERDRALGAYTWALMSSRNWKLCAETAATEAPRMKRGQPFSRVVLAGLSCASEGFEGPQKILEPLAEEAIALPQTLRDHRFQLYQQLMHADKTTVKRWGDQWLKELDATKPANDDERSALDVARVDAASVMGEPERVLPAVRASERAMPENYNASLRLAQMEGEAKYYDAAIAACDRGLAHVTGPLGRTWFLQTKAEALIQKGRRDEALPVLQQALTSARMIGVKQSRDRNVERVSELIKKINVTR